MLFFSLSKIMFFCGAFVKLLEHVVWLDITKLMLEELYKKKLLQKLEFFLCYFAQDSAKMSARCSRTRKKLICLEISN